MKASEFNWRVLRTPVIVLAVALSISAVILVSSYMFRDSMELDYDRKQQEFNSISSKYLAVDEQEKLIAEYYPGFVELYNKGVVGRERRLDWIEALRQAGERLKIPSLRYEISARSGIEQPVPVNLGRYTLQATTMTLRLEMAHEADLTRLLTTLDRVAPGIYTVSSCEIRRKDRVIAISEDATNVSAECELIWFNLQLASGEEITLS